jgi:hypothetical protein
MFSRDYLPAGLCANASGNVINFKLKGAATFSNLSVSGSAASFQLTPSGFSAVAPSVPDTGTVTLTVNGTAISTANYGYGSTPAFIAQELAAVASSSQVNVTAAYDTLQIVSKTAGADTDYTYSVQISDTAGFSQPSFSASPPAATLNMAPISSSLARQPRSTASRAATIPSATSPAILIP